MPKACIFDLDGTLIDSLKDLAFSSNRALEIQGFPTHETNKYKYFVGRGAANLAASILPENARTPEISRTILDLFNEHYDAHYLDTTLPYDGIPELLLKLKSLGYKLAVISNKPNVFTKKLVSELFLDEFDYVTGKRDGVPSKPDPASVFDACKAIGVEPLDCLYIGDSGVDMQTAKAAGIFSVGVLWGFRDRTELLENGAQALIERPIDLLNLLK